MAPIAYEAALFMNLGYKTDVKFSYLMQLVFEESELD